MKTLKTLRAERLLAQLEESINTNLFAIRNIVGFTKEALADRKELRKLTSSYYERRADVERALKAYGNVRMILRENVSGMERDAVEFINEMDKYFEL